MPIRASATAVFFALVACSSGRVAATAAPGLPPCPAAQVDTTGWVLTRNHALGVEFRRPPRYVLKVWEVSFPENHRGNKVEWRRDGGIRWMFEFEVADSLRAAPHPEFLRHLKDARWCSLMTFAGVAEVLLHRSGGATYGGRDVVPYYVAMWLRAGGGRVVRFDSSSADSTGAEEHLAVARTLRLVAPPQTR